MTTAKRRPLTAHDAKRVFSMRDPLSMLDAARVMRIRYQVALRLVKSGKVNGKKLEGRYFVERAEAERALRERPWAPWASRLAPNGKRRPRKLLRDAR